MYIYLSARNALPMTPLSQVKVSYMILSVPIETYLYLLLYDTSFIHVSKNSTRTKKKHICIQNTIISYHQATEISEFF